jgi:hypothetical protein
MNLHSSKKSQVTLKAAHSQMCATYSLSLVNYVRTYVLL